MELLGGVKKASLQRLPREHRSVAGDAGWTVIVVGSAPTVTASFVLLGDGRRS